MSAANIGSSSSSASSYRNESGGGQPNIESNRDLKRSELGQENSGLDFSMVPDEILMEIFQYAIKSQSDVQRLSFVSKKLNNISFDEEIWKRLSEKFGYEQIEQHNWRVSFYLNLEKSVASAIAQIMNPEKQALAQIQLVKVLPSKENIDKANNLIDTMPLDRQLNLRTELIKALFEYVKNLQLSSPLSFQIIDSYLVVKSKAQRLVLTGNKVEEFMFQSFKSRTSSLSEAHRLSARSEIALALNSNIDKALNVLDKMCETTGIASLKIEELVEFLKVVFAATGELPKATDKHIKQHPGNCAGSLSLKFELLKFLISIGQIKKTKKIIERKFRQMMPYYKAKFELELLKFLHSRKKINKAKKSINKLSNISEKDQLQIEFLVILISIGYKVEANEVIKELDPSNKNRVLFEVEKALNSIGKIQEAYELNSEITDLRMKAENKVALLAPLISIGDMDKANKIIAELKDYHWTKDEDKINFIKGLISIGRTTEAYESIKEFGPVHHHQSLLLELVKALISMGDMDEANKITSEITDCEYKFEAQIEFVKALISMGDMDEANKITSEITDCEYKFEAQIEFVKAEPSKENIEKAIKLLSEIDNNEYVKILKEKLIITLISMGNMDEANKIIEEGISEWEKLNLIRALLSIGEIKEANEMIKKLTDPGYKSSTQAIFVHAILS
ncbi:MAG: hypothetical protein K1060chlam1_00618 [Candidatus Anoxychlamydiales bacterium]|nr:hypothetical protein [Candidatus Anoxychlamydiales bacterium]